MYFTEGILSGTVSLLTDGRGSELRWLILLPKVLANDLWKSWILSCVIQGDYL